MDYHHNPPPPRFSATDTEIQQILALLSSSAEAAAAANPHAEQPSSPLPREIAHSSPSPSASASSSIIIINGSLHSPHRTQQQRQQQQLTYSRHQEEEEDDNNNNDDEDEAAQRPQTPDAETERVLALLSENPCVRREMLNYDDDEDEDDDDDKNGDGDGDDDRDDRNEGLANIVAAGGGIVDAQAPRSSETNACELADGAFRRRVVASVAAAAAAAAQSPPSERGSHLDRQRSIFSPRKPPVAAGIFDRRDDIASRARSEVLGDPIYQLPSLLPLSTAPRLIPYSSLSDPRLPLWGCTSLMGPATLLLSDGFAVHLLSLLAPASVELEGFLEIVSGVGRAAEGGGRKLAPDEIVEGALRRKRLVHVSDGPRGGIWFAEGEGRKGIVGALLALNEESSEGGGWEVLGLGTGGCEGRVYMIHPCRVEGSETNKDGRKGSGKGKEKDRKRVATGVDTRRRKDECRTERVDLERRGGQIKEGFRDRLLRKI